MIRCSRCVIPDTVPGVTFDGDGVCSVCREYKPYRPLGEEAFREVLASARNGSNGYNCVVPLSGGRDSTYVLYLAKAVHGLKPLAVNYDNEFQNPQTVGNIQRTCKTLNVDLKVVRSRKDISRRIVAANAKIAAPRGVGELARAFCRQCVYGYYSAVFIEAERHGVPLILWGTSQLETTEKVRVKALQHLIHNKWSKLADPKFYQLEYLALRQRAEFPVSGNALFARNEPKLRNGKIREVSVYDYVPWERRKIKETIARELGWQKPDGHISTWRADCILHELVNFFFVRAVGCTQDCMGYTNMIAAGQMTREEALEQEEQAVQIPWEHIESLLREWVGLSARDVEKMKPSQ